MPEEEASTRTQKRALRTRRKLLGAALAIFYERGVDATTIEEITERADVGKGTFYRHFTCKEDLVLALAEDASDRLIKLLQGSKKPPTGLQDVLERIFEVHARFFTSHREDFLLLFQGRLLLKTNNDTDGGIQVHVNRFLRELENQLGPFVPPPVTPVQIHFLAFGVAGLISGFFSFAIVGSDPEELKKNLKSLRRAFVSGCQAFIAERFERRDPTKVELVNTNHSPSTPTS
jgi:AcrR family transcriptional regulator